VKKPLVSIYIRAYNAEKYIEKAIKSVINQSLSDIELILQDNASSDNTGQICSKYAEQDNRIIFLRNEKNTVIHRDYKGEVYIPSGEYYCFLDADDYLDKNFIELMYKSAKENEADIVVCGMVAFWDKNPSANYTRVPPEIISIGNSNLKTNFIELYGTLRTIWGKLYKTQFFLENANYANTRPEWLLSGSDTLAVLRLVKKCNTFVAINKALYNYRVYDDSYYNKNVSVDRVKEARFLYKEALELLKDWEIESEEYMGFLRDVYMNSLIDTLQNALLHAELFPVESIKLIHSILNDELFNDAIKEKDKKNEIFELSKSSVDLIIQNKDINNCFEENEYEELFLLRAVKLVANRSDFSNDDFLLQMFIIVCHPKNKYNWGISYLKRIITENEINCGMKIIELVEKESSILKDPIKMRNIINKIDEKEDKDIQIKKQLLSDYFKNERIEEAISILNEILSRKKVDLDGLYYKILLSWTIGEKEYSMNTSDIASFFWCDDADMLALCGDVYAANGKTRKAIETYYNALNLNITEEFREELKLRIKEINLI